MGWTRLRGARVTLRVAEESDVPELARIRTTPEVRARWRGGDDLALLKDLKMPVKALSATL